MAVYRNVRGRRGGRGGRPWVLLPKVLAVAVYFGAVVAATVVWFAGPAGGGPAAVSDEAVRLAVVNEVGRLLLHVAVPAVVVAMLLGVALLVMQGAGVMLRQRWLRVKLGLLAVGVPAMHVIMAWHVDRLRQLAEAGTWDDGAAGRLSVGLVGLIIGSAAVIVLGRLKPRLGQNWAKAYRAATGRNEVSNASSEGASNIASDMVRDMARDERSGR